MSSLSLINIKPYPKRTRDTLRPGPQRAMPFTVKALGGRAVATEPDRHFETLRGGLLPSLANLVITDLFT